MTSAISALRNDMTYEGKIISCPEFHMVRTLHEARGCGAVRRLMTAILREYKNNGDPSASTVLGHSRLDEIHSMIDHYEVDDEIINKVQKRKQSWLLK